MEAVEAELLRADAQVAVLVEPDGERQPISDEEPLANVKLALVHQKRPLCQTTPAARLIANQPQTNWRHGS